MKTINYEVVLSADEYNLLEMAAQVDGRMTGDDVKTMLLQHARSVVRRYGDNLVNEHFMRMRDMITTEAPTLKLGGRTKVVPFDKPKE